MRPILSFLFALISSGALASSFEVDGLYYLVTSSTTVSVTAKPSATDGSGGIGFNQGYSGNVTVPSHVTADGVTYTVSAATDNAFRSSSKLQSVSLPATLVDLGEAPFASCSKLASITVASDNPAYTSINGVLYDKSATTLIACPGDTRGDFVVPSSVTTIANSAFHGCYRLTSITLPASVSDIGPNAFRTCTAMRSINIPDGITEIKEGMLYGCRSLASITLPSSLTTIGDYGLYYCSNLRSITFPSTLRSIGSMAFVACTFLPKLEFPEGLKSIGYRAFESCSQVQGVSLPASLEYVGAGAFRGCNLLPSIDVASGNQHFMSDGGILLDHDKTRDICCPGGWKGAYTVPSTVTVIEEYAFYYCMGLTAVTLPNQLSVIRPAAFTKCEKLQTIILPQHLTLIGRSAFTACTGLTSVWSRSLTPPTISEEVFAEETYSMPLYVSSKAMSEYARAAYWKKFNLRKLIGDVNGDGAVSVVDAMILVAYITGNDYSPFELSLGDLNDDHTISIVDVMEVVKIITGD